MSAHCAGGLHAMCFGTAHDAEGRYVRCECTDPACVCYEPADQQVAP